MLAGDSLTTLSLNFQWRRILAIALQFWFTHGYEGLAATNEDYFEALIQDLYNAENFNLQAYRIARVDIGSNFSTNSLAAVTITNSGISHTFTYPNARIRCYNVGLVNGVAGQNTIAIIRLIGESPDENGYAENKGTVTKEHTVLASFSGIPVGVSKTLELMLQVTGNTGTISAVPYLIWEIEEWD